MYVSKRKFSNFYQDMKKFSKPLFTRPRTGPNMKKDVQFKNYVTYDDELTDAQIFNSVNNM